MSSRRCLYCTPIALLGLALACGGKVDAPPPQARQIGMTDLCHGRTAQEALDALPTFLRSSYTYHPTPNTLGSTGALTIKLTYEGKAASCVDQRVGAWDCPPPPSTLSCVYAPQTSDEVSVPVRVDLQSDDGRFANSAQGTLDLAPDGTLTFAAELVWDDLSATAKKDLTAIHEQGTSIDVQGTATTGLAGPKNYEGSVTRTIGTWD